MISDPTLFLVFQLGNDRYALDTAQVVEVFPLVKLKEIPHGRPCVAGAFLYHGSPVPVVDLTELATGRSSRAWLSTRIILANYTEPDGEAHRLGLIAEQATETIRRDDAEFVDAGVAVDEAPYLGPVTNDARGMIQRIEINQLLPAEVRDMLFRQPVEI